MNAHIYALPASELLAHLVNIVNPPCQFLVLQLLLSLPPHLVVRLHRTIVDDSIVAVGQQRGLQVFCHLPAVRSFTESSVRRTLACCGSSVSRAYDNHEILLVHISSCF